MLRNLLNGAVTHTRRRISDGVSDALTVEIALIAKSCSNNSPPATTPAAAAAARRRRKMPAMTQTAVVTPPAAAKLTKSSPTSVITCGKTMTGKANGIPAPLGSRRWLPSSFINDEVADAAAKSASSLTVRLNVKIYEQQLQ